MGRRIDLETDPCIPDQARRVSYWFQRRTHVGKHWDFVHLRPSAVGPEVWPEPVVNRGGGLGRSAICEVLRFCPPFRTYPSYKGRTVGLVPLSAISWFSLLVGKLYMDIIPVTGNVKPRNLRTFSVRIINLDVAQ